MNIEELAQKADDEADQLINMPGKYHSDRHDVRDSIFAALVMEEAAKVCDSLQDVPATEPRHCAEDIRIEARALKGAKE